MTTTNIVISSDVKDTVITVDGKVMFTYSTPSALMVPIECYNAAFGSVLSLAFADHIRRYGAINNGR